MHRQGEVTDITSAQSYIRFVTSAEEGNVAFAIQVGQRCAGMVGINGALAHHLGWFFYWMHPDFRSLGFTRRAAATVADWALGHLKTTDDGGFQRLEVGHRITNPASGAVAEAAGFLPEGLERQKLVEDGRRVDVRTYGRLRSDPASGMHPLPLQPVTARQSVIPQPGTRSLP